MRSTSLAILLVVSTLSLAQKIKSAPRDPISIPKMELGTSNGTTYTNRSIGVQFTVPDGLEFQAPELKGIPGSVPELVSVMAWQKETLISPRKITYFYSDALAYYSQGERSTEAYMRKVIKYNVTTNFKAVEEDPHFALNGIFFARADFTGPLYEVVLVKACETQALVFIFGISNSNKQAVDKLISETELRLDPVKSRCH